MHDRSTIHLVRNIRVVAPALIRVAYHEEQKGLNREPANQKSEHPRRDQREEKENFSDLWTQIYAYWWIEKDERPELQDLRGHLQIRSRLIYVKKTYRAPWALSWYFSFSFCQVLPILSRSAGPGIQSHSA